MAELGDIVGQKYRLIRKLGEGGMGTVYEAADEQLGGQVAIKLIHPELEDTPESLLRFRREAEAAATAGHEAIVGIFDFGHTDEGSHFLVMELLNGQSLNQKLNELGNLGVSETAFVGCQTLSGLFAAHRVGVIHRDLKPDNIFLVESEDPVPAVKILDFGTSLLRDRQGYADDSQRLTREGTIIGTPEYMCPEQARGKLDLDERADIYSLGLILYECMTGRPPFIAPNPNEVLFKLLTEEAENPKNIRPDVPEEFDNLIMWAIRKDREERPRTSREMFDALIPFVSEPHASHIVWPADDGSDEAPTGFETFRVEMPENITDLETLDKYVAAQTEAIDIKGIDDVSLDNAETIPIRVSDIKIDKAQTIPMKAPDMGLASGRASGSDTSESPASPGAPFPAPLTAPFSPPSTPQPPPPTASSIGTSQAPPSSMADLEAPTVETPQASSSDMSLSSPAVAPPARDPNAYSPTMVLPDRARRRWWEGKDNNINMTVVVLIALAFILCLSSIALGIWLALR